ncbi:salicylic acid-binding protein 2-like protein [Tanacetum coccineum]
MQNACDKHTHFVLVHGLGHGAWCWFKLKPLLESAGHRVSTFNLLASGTDTKVIQQVPTFYNYNTPLLDFMASVPPEEKVILVGHSLGGMNISLAMENFPKKISVAVFLTAFMPDTIHEPSYVIEQVNYFCSDRNSQDTWLDTQFLPYRDEESEVSILFGPKFVSSKLYQLCSDEDRELGKILIRPGSLFLKDLPNTKQFTGEGYGSVRRVFVLSDDDETIKEDFQRWMIDNSRVVEVKELKETPPILCHIARSFSAFASSSKCSLNAAYQEVIVDTPSQ